MQDTEEMVTLLRTMPTETVSAFRDVVEVLAAVQDDRPRREALVTRMERLTESRNVTTETMREMLAEWRAEWGYTREDARRRVEAEPELEAHRDTILYDWPEGEEHWEWVCAAPVSEIVEWAEVVEKGAQEVAEAPVGVA